MTTELKKQKLYKYLDTATAEEIEDMYENYLDESGPIEWNDALKAEMEQRREDYLSGKGKTVSVAEAMEYALNSSHR